MYINLCPTWPQPVASPQCMYNYAVARSPSQWLALSVCPTWPQPVASPQCMYNYAVARSPSIIMYSPSGFRDSEATRACVAAQVSSANKEQPSATQSLPTAISDSVSQYQEQAVWQPHTHTQSSH